MWGIHSALDVERVHLLFCKRVLHVKRSTANYFIYGELGRFPLQITSKIRILKYWNKIITGMSNPLVKRAYDIEYEMCEKSPSFSGWIMSLKSLLYNMGLNFAWDNQSIVYHNVFLHLCKQRLHDLYLTKWNAALSASSDGLLYKSYKVMPCYSNFNKIVIPKHRYVFVKFVTKNHRLPVVSGEWQTI